MSEVTRKSTRFLTIVTMTVMVLAAIPVGLVGLASSDEGGAAPRVVTDDSEKLIVPEGESYELFGCHTYTDSIQISGTLKVKPFTGSGDNSGMIVLSAPTITVGANGVITGDGRGFGGGGGGTSWYTSGYAGGSGGSGGTGGRGADAISGYAAGGGGGGSNASTGGRSPSGYGDGSAGTELKGGDGGTWSSYYGGTGGKMFGGGGGGGHAASAYGGGGGGGGGSGGKNAADQNGGAGGGAFGGAGGVVQQYYWASSMDGKNGGYGAPDENGDGTTDLSVWKGSGGGGGGAANYYTGGGGGGGAGGAAITLRADNTLTVTGTVTSRGAPGGGGGRYSTDPSYWGGRGGGGAGGGIALVATRLVVTGVVDNRGSIKDALDAANGGTVKLSYSQKDLAQAQFLTGRYFANGKPDKVVLLSPPNEAETVPVPVFMWNEVTDPDKDPVTYRIQVATVGTFANTIIDASALKRTSYTSPGPLASGTTYFWRVAASDPLGPGDWSEVWSFGIDKTPPVSKVHDLPRYMTELDFDLSWSGDDNAAGIQAYTIYVSDNNQGFVPWIIDTPKLTALFQGKDGHNYRFYSSAVDKAGNREGAHLTADATTSVDITPPVSTLDYIEPYQAMTEIPLSWSGKDATSGVANYTVYVSVDNGEFTPWLTRTIQKTATYKAEEGHLYQIYVRAYDNAGNLEPVPESARILTIRTDLTPPYTMVSMGWPTYGQGPVYILPSNNIMLSQSDNYVGVNMTFYQMDGQLVKDYAGPFKETQFGSHNMSYWSVDLAGNEETRQTIWFFTDGEAPTTTLSFEGPNFAKSDIVYISSETRMVLAVSDRGSGVNRTEHYFDNGDGVTYIDPFGLTQPGTHVLYYRSSDNLGSIEIERSVRMALDTVPPVTTPSYPVGPQSRDVSVRLRASDYESGLNDTQYRVLKNGEIERDWTSGSEIAITVSDDPSHPDDGNYRIEFYSTDGVGNKEATKYVMVTVDTQAILGVEIKGGKVDNEKYTVRGRAEPGARVTLNGNPVTVLNDGTFTATVMLKEGSNKLTFKSTDDAGNTATVVKTVDYSPPFTLSAPVVMMLVVVLIILALAGAVMALRRKG